MALSASLEASFSAGGFDLGAAIAGLGTLLTDVQLPGLDIDVSVSLDVGGVGTGGVTEALASITGGLDGIVAGLPDVGALLGPLQLAMRVPELIAEFDLDALIAAITAAVVPSGGGLPEFVAATMSIGSVPLVGTLADLTGALGLDLRAPGAMIGGAAGGVVSLVQLFGALLAVESISRTIDERAALASELLGAERLTGLISRVRAAGGIHLAGLLEGIDPDDAGIVEVVAPPVEAYLALVGELTGLLVRSLAFAQATVTDADFAALLLGLAAATLGLTDAAVTPVRALVDSALPLVSPFLSIDVPAGGHDVVFGAVADIRTSIEAAIDDIAPSTISALVTPAIDPVLAPVRAVRAALDEVAAIVGVVFDPIDQALGAVDLQPVRAAIERVTEPVDTVIGALGDAIAGAQSAIDTVVSGVHDALTPVRTTLTNTVGTLTAPFTSVHTTIAALDLAALQADLHAVLDSVTAAIASAPVQPVFDVATGIINTAADALGLVPKALLPDDLRNELEAACAPVESLDLEPARAELHAQLASMIASLDASTLDALAAGFQAVQEFIASIDPHPHVEGLEREEFAELLSGLDAIDPTTILAPVTDALDAARDALNGIDLLDVLRPVDEALDDVVATIQGVDPTAALQPVADALDSATGAVREALHLDGIEAALDGVEQAVADAVTKVPLTAALDAAEAAWADLVAALGHPSVDGGVTRALLAGLLPGVPVAGVGEVIAWIRGERDGATVVRARLQHAAALLDASATAVAAIDIRALTAELDAAHRALTAAVSAHPPDSLLGGRLAIAIGTTNPAPDLGRVVVNVDGTKDAFATASAAVAVATAPDRSEVTRTAAGLGAAFAPLAPAVHKVGELAAFVGVDADTLGGPGGPRLALVALAETVGPEPILGTLRSILTKLTTRVTELVRDGLIAPLRGAIGELNGLLDALSVSVLTQRFTDVRDHLTAVIEGLRPATVLAEPLAVFDAVKATLATFDPMGPARAAVDALKAEITSFAHDFAPTRVLAPVLTVYDDIAGGVNAFDVSGLLTPVLNALDEIGRIIDHGMDEVIDAIGELKSACESDGGPIPGLDLSLAASVDVGGSFGL